MGVYIKGMEMPTSCLECRLFNDPWCMAKNRNQWRTAYNRPPKGERQNDCPLVEIPPHGELIEKSVIEKAINDACAECKEACIEFDGFFADCDQCIFHDVKKALVNAPTIIPASCENPAKSRDRQGRGGRVMYDELVEALRHYFVDVPLVLQAADAIEELQKNLERTKDFEAFWQHEAEDALRKYQVAVANKPRWIPVTERLPKCEWGAEVGNIEWISCGMVFAGCFGRGGKYRDAYFRTWTDGTEGIDVKDADYWMPIQIPEQPKEK